MQRFIISLSALAAFLFLFAASTGTAWADNPAGAPANHIGTTVADIAQSSDPNFGQAVCKPGALDQLEDDGTLSFLGLTPSGNTP